MNKKILLSLFIIFFLTGCSANYNLKIDNGTIKEKLTINNTDINRFKNILHK